jgi:ATP-dependent DNA helicase RecQ
VSQVPEDRALEILREGLGPEATFHDGQWEAIEPLLGSGARLLVIQRTGWGKSVVYFLATRLLRERGAGPTILISPLLALMRNQIDLADQFHVRAATINSSNVGEWAEIERELRADRMDLLLISPERLGNERFRDQMLSDIERRAGLLVIDEAHCISDWGHDFRPDYRRILASISRLDPKVPILGTTATANDRVVADIKAQLGEDLIVVRGPLMRESLRARAIRLHDQAERLAWLAKHVPRLEGTGIIYTSTVNDTTRVAEWLRTQGVTAEAYHGGVETEERLRLEASFRNNEIKALVATTALGMGYDKPDVAFVIHFQRPGSIIGYYQQIGRAGRAIPKAEVVLLTGAEDDDIVEYFIESAFPDADCFAEVIAAIGQKPLSIDATCGKTNFRRGQVEKALQLLEVEGAAVKEDGRFRLVDPEWRYEGLRAEQITGQRRAELEQMREYTDTTGCRMRFLARSLDSPSLEDCGRCDRCKPVTWPPLDRAKVVEAIEFLRGGSLPIKPKKFWPPGFLDEGRKKMDSGDLLLPGVALCVYNDAGWGALVRRGKYELGKFPDELLEPCAKAIGELEDQPQWITYIPSLKRGSLVPEFAARLAEKLGIEFVLAVKKVHQNKEQKLMQNSTTQLANVWDSFEVVETRPGVGLLFDDVIDSGWTMTCVGAKLRRAGSGPIIPFALATATPRDDA